MFSIFGLGALVALVLGNGEEGGEEGGPKTSLELTQHRPVTNIDAMRVEPKMVEEKQKLRQDRIFENLFVRYIIGVAKNETIIFWRPSVPRYPVP